MPTAFSVHIVDLWFCFLFIELFLEVLGASGTNPPWFLFVKLLFYLMLWTDPVTVITGIRFVAWGFVFVVRYGRTHCPSALISAPLVWFFRCFCVIKTHLPSCVFEKNGGVWIRVGKCWNLSFCCVRDKHLGLLFCNYYVIFQVLPSFLCFPYIRRLN